MKKIHRMIFLEIVPLFIMANFFFVFLLLIEQLVELAELIFVRSIPFYMVAETIIYYLPSFLVITIPISALLAVLLAFSRFGSDSELVAMNACGASNLTFIAPTLVFGIIAALIGVYTGTVLLPKGSTLAVGNLNRMLENLSINDIREKEMYSDITGMIFYANRKLDVTNFEEIILIDTQRNSIISAQKATIVPNANRSIIIRFSGGKFTVMDDEISYSSLSFDNMTVNFPIELTVSLMPMNEKLMSLRELRDNFGESGIYKFEYIKRFTMPISAVIMSLMGLAMGQKLQRSGRSIGIVIACVLAFAINALFIVGENMAATMNPVLLAWLPILIFTAIMLPMLYKSSR